MGESKNGNMPLDLQKGSKFAVLTTYRSNGNMPLDLQKGSKFTVLIRHPYKQNTESMPLDLQKGSKFAVLAKDTIYTALLLSFFKRKP
jgi:hypothetical protein